MSLIVAVDVFKAGETLQHYEFSSDHQRLVRIGKLPSAQVRLDEPAASRVHAIIEVSHAQAMLVDMGADSGTLVNGKRASKVKLSHGDKIVIGATELIVSIGTNSADNAAKIVTNNPISSGMSVSQASVPEHSQASTNNNSGQGSNLSAAVYREPSKVPTNMNNFSQRLIAKMRALDANMLAEVELYIDWIAYRQQGARQNYSATSVALPIATAKVAQIPAQASFISQAQAVRTAPYANVSQPVMIPTSAMAVTAVASKADAETVQVQQPAASNFPPNRKPPRDTLSYVKQMRRSRRWQQIIIGGVLVVVAIIMLITLFKPSKINLNLPDAATTPATTPTKTTSTSGESGSAATTTDTAVDGESTAEATTPLDASKPPSVATVDTNANSIVPNAQIVIYRIPDDQSLSEIANNLWPNSSNAFLLQKENPIITSIDVKIARGTVIRIPKIVIYKVQTGDTLASIAEKYFGSANEYKTIQNANKLILPNPESLIVGTSLIIPLVNQDLEKRFTLSLSNVKEETKNNKTVAPVATESIKNEPAETATPKQP
ncbi:MAG: FHA domain-containing protein [Deltaproteobacteria bacterium]|nr:FHA domain-containing protein [Deltaproteobacteria bacterium]